jgi:hypothetical protein
VLGFIDIKGVLEVTGSELLDARSITGGKSSGVRDGVGDLKSSGVLVCVGEG